MKSFLLGVFLLATQYTFAQCEVGEIELYMNVFVDPWGEETYWEITPAGTGCGNQTIGYGSNSQEVGCQLGLPVTGAYGYPDNTMITEGPFCLTEGEDYDLYLGGIYYGKISEDNTVSDFAGAMLYMIHEKFYETFLTVSEEKDIDRSLANKGKYIVCNSFVAIQHNGYSDNKKKVNYDSYLKGRILFK